MVEVDALYIRGMLNHPDIQPNATINRWIAGILLFSFSLVHVPSKHIAADGVSHHTPQPNDEPNTDIDFEDWIDHANGFMHVINSSSLLPTSINALVLFPVFGVDAISVGSEDVPYSSIPQAKAAKCTDTRLDGVRTYLISLECPPNLTDQQYYSFI